MSDVKAILARLQKGETADAIAEEFANMINDAIKLNDAEVQKKKAEEEKNAKLDACAIKMGEAIKEYIAIAEPELAAEAEDEILDAKAIRDAMDGIIAAVKFSLSAYEKLNASANGSADDIIGNFLKNFVD